MQVGKSELRNRFVLLLQLKKSKQFDRQLLGPGIVSRRDPLETLIGSYLAHEFPVLYGTLSLIAVFRRARHRAVS
jgi:hypothetical protein